MKHCFTLLFSYLSFASFAQINIGNNQTICLGDTAQIIATTSVIASTDSYQLVNINFSPLTNTGTSVFLSDDDVQGPFPIGFSFQFYGITYSQFYIGSNGWMGFSSGQSTSLSAVALPSTATTTPKNCIMLSWEDLLPPNGVVKYQTIGTAPNRKLLMSFENVPHYNSPNTFVTSQIVLYEGSNIIENHVTDKDISANNNNSVQGIQDSLGQNALVVPGRNATIWSASNESVRYFPSGVTWFDVNSGQMVGVGDTLFYSPSQTTYVAAQIIDSNGVVHADTMRLNVKNTQITPSGLSLCNGPITLTGATGYALYVWNNNTASPILNVNTPGTYYVNCTSSNGSVCTSPSITIYADTIPISLSMADSIDICQGDTIHFSGPSGYSSYSWSNGSTTQDIIATVDGAYFLVATDANGCIGISDTTIVSTKILHPNIWANVLSLCNGFGTSIYTDNIYQSYLWNTGGTFSSDYTSVPGNFWVSVTDQNGCTGTSDTITIFGGNFTYNLLPSDSIFLCNNGSSVTLDAANSMSVSSYLWNTGATTSTITTNTPGNYYCITTTWNGCIGFSDTVEVSSLHPQINYSGLSLCAGAVSLDAGNYSNFSWNNGSNMQNILVNMPGDYFVFITDSNGCTGYSDTISVYDSVFVYNIVPSGSTNICSGYTVDLDAGNQFLNHQWNTGATTPSITASTTGSYFATMTDVNGCSGITDTIQVSNLNINLSTTGYSLCNPNNYPVLSVGNGYNDYTWFYMGSMIDTTASITVNLPGDYYVSVVDANGCSDISDTITIYLNNFLFDLTASADSICQPGGQTTLSAGNSFFSYNWNTGAITQQITINTTGIYTVNVMDMNGCLGSSNPFTVYNIVNTSALSGQSSVLLNATESYSVVNHPNSSYNWFVTNGVIQSGQGTNSVVILWNNLGSGAINVLETDANGCVGDTIQLWVTITQVSGLEENNLSDVIVYPNPFSDYTTIYLPQTKEEFALTLVDITGRKVWEKVKITDNALLIQKGVLAKGIYFLKIKQGNQEQIQKIVIR